MTREANHRKCLAAGENQLRSKRRTPHRNTNFTLKPEHVLHEYVGRCLAIKYPISVMLMRVNVAKSWDLVTDEFIPGTLPIGMLN